MPDINSTLFMSLASGGLAGAFFTQIINFVISRRSKTKVYLTQDALKFYNVASDVFEKYADIKTSITYKDKIYDKLSRYTVCIENTGSKKIQNAQAVISLPKDVTCLEKNIKTQPIIINYTETSSADEDRNELTFSFNDLQEDDAIQIALFLQGEFFDDIKCTVRNVDEVKSTSKALSFDATRDAVGVVLFFFFLYNLAGKVDSFGTILQMFLVLIAIVPVSTRITAIIKSFQKNNKKPKKWISIEGLQENASDVNINIVQN